MKKTQRYGFTLVELLVVISIIGMLAGMLLPAVNAAREAGRRATCVSNQSQVALALLNYENSRNAFPALRTANNSDYDNYGSVSWVAQILINLEYNAAADVISQGKVSGSGANLYDLVLPVMRCKSTPSFDIPSSEGITSYTSNAIISYVVNGGYQNTYGATWDEDTIEDADSNEYVFEPSHKEDAVFFDRFGRASDSSGVAYDAKPSTSVEYISKNNGTGFTLLLSENLDAKAWITNASNKPESLGEKELAFCYPSNGGTAQTAGANEAVAFGDGSNNKPMYINQNRGGWNTGYAYARPSSNHPGIAVAAFADRSVRPLSENMSRSVFIQICRPKSGDIIDPNDLGL